jgi:hypothetical protein
MVDETTAVRERLTPAERQNLVRDARLGLERMIEITEQARP